MPLSSRHLARRCRVAPVGAGAVRRAARAARYTSTSLVRRCEVERRADERCHPTQSSVGGQPSAERSGCLADVAARGGTCGEGGAAQRTPTAPGFLLCLPNTPALPPRPPLL
eukprot:scaffold27511_cov32-Tisochrysis_lutea.AAC.4